MAYGNIVKSIGLDVPESSVDFPISAPFTPVNNKEALVTVVLGSVSEAAGITFKLKDSYDKGLTYQAVGSESQTAALVKKTIGGGIQEVTDFTWPAFASAAQGDYVDYTSQEGVTFAVWLDLDADGTEPTGPIFGAADQQIKVSIVTGNTAAQVAAAARAAVIANAAWVAAFTTSAVSTATFTVTQVMSGDVSDAVPHAEGDVGAGSITTSTTTDGADGDLDLGTSIFSETTHGFLTGQRVLLDGTPPTPLTTGTHYYLIADDANTFSLAETQADALAGTVIEPTDYGSGDWRLYAADLQIRMIESDTSDIAQLPLQDLVQVVANTGSGDAVTIAAVWTAEAK